MALMAAVLASVACGIVGSYVTVRRSTYIAGAIAHCTLGGMGLARYLQIEMGLSWATPLTGAILAALLAGLLISFLQNRPGMRLDTVLSAVWATGMAIGILFISRTQGYNEDLMSYLFGDILMVTRTDLILIGILDIFLVSVAFFFQRELDAIAFDEEFARLSGLPVRLYDTIFLLVVALTVVLLVQLVGIILVVALLALPAAAAARITARLPTMILASVLLCLLASIGGLTISYPLDLPAGAMIILVAGAIYLVSSFISIKVAERP
jgi:zinc transport system permease protein